MSIFRDLAKTAGIIAARTVAAEAVRIGAEQLGNRLGRDHAAVRILDNAYLLAHGHNHHAGLHQYTAEQCSAHAEAEMANKNYGSAKQWAEMGAERSDTNCMLILGIIYENGHGLPVDIGVAAKSYMNALNHGEREYSPGFILRMGTHYATGEIVTQNLDVAACLLNVARQFGTQQESLIAAQWLVIVKPPLTIEG
jgi:TPR repeat protein